MSDKNKSIKEELKDAAMQLSEMDPVVTLIVNPFPSRRRSDIAGIIDREYKKLAIKLIAKILELYYLD